MENNIPELRFPEFNAPLNGKNLGQIADITKLAGYEYTKHVVYSKTGSIIGLRAINIKNNRITLDDVQYIDDSDFSKLNRSKLFIGDLLFTYIGANIGDIAVVPENDRFYLAPNISRIRCEETQANFSYIFQYFRRTKFQKSEITKYIASSSQPALAMENIRKFKVIIPEVREQIKIAKFLSLIDDRISLLQKKKDELELYKKGIMQQLFNQEIRFKDENECDYPDWTAKKLGEICDIVGGGTPSTTIDEYWNGEYHWFTPTEIKNKYLFESQRKISELGFKKSSAKLLPINTILFTSRATIGDVGIAKVKCTTNQGFQSFLPNENYETEYLYYWLILNKKKFLRKSSGSTFIEISKKAISKIGIRIPCISEQRKIASFLSSIDNSINNLGTNISESSDFKRGLMQKMFV